MPQNADDEPASELLKRIAKEKTRLVKTGDARKSHVDPVGSAEAPFLIPISWVWTRLGSAGDWGSGSTPPRGNTEYYGGNITWLKSGELNDNRQLSGSEETLTQFALERGSFRLNRPGDVLIAMYGATIGKVAILAENAVTNQAVCGCTPFAGVFNQFLFLFLHSQRERFHTASEGGAQPNISKVKIIWTPFPLPPIAEQHRIVAKVDELMALCDRLEKARQAREATRDRLTATSLARLNTPNPETFQADACFALDALPALTARPDQIKQLRQAVLNLSVRGKLVPQDPNDEPASELLKRIAKEKRNTAFRAWQRRNDSRDQQEVQPAFELPANWNWTNLGELSLEMRYGTAKKCDYETVGTPVLRIPNVSGGRINLDNIKFGPLTQNEKEELSLRRGDLLVIRSNGSLDIVGRAAEVEVSAEGMSFAGYLVRVRLSVENLLPRFVWLAMNTDHVRDQIEKPIRSAVGLKNVNSTELAALSFPFPPLERTTPHRRQGR